MGRGSVRCGAGAKDCRRDLIELPSPGTILRRREEAVDLIEATEAPPPGVLGGMRFSRPIRGIMETRPLGGRRKPLFGGGGIPEVPPAAAVAADMGSMLLRRLFLLGASFAEGNPASVIRRGLRGLR